MHPPIVNEEYMFIYVLAGDEVDIFFCGESCINDISVSPEPVSRFLPNLQGYITGTYLRAYKVLMC